MTFNLFKKNITAEEMATGLYHATVSNTVKDSIKDHDGKTLLTKKEQSILLTQHLYDLLERRNYKKASVYLLTTYVVNNHKIKDDSDLTFEMAMALDAIKKISKFIKEISPESHIFFKQKFFFDKSLDSIQKTLVMQWYVSHCKIIDSAFESSMKQFKVIDKE